MADPHLPDVGLFDEFLVALIERCFLLLQVPYPLQVFEADRLGGFDPVQRGGSWPGLVVSSTCNSDGAAGTAGALLSHCGCRFHGVGWFLQSFVIRLLPPGNHALFPEVRCGPS